MSGPPSALRSRETWTCTVLTAPPGASSPHSAMARSPALTGLLAVEEEHREDSCRLPTGDCDNSSFAADLERSQYPELHRGSCPRYRHRPCAATNGRICPLASGLQAAQPKVRSRHVHDLPGEPHDPRTDGRSVADRLSAKLAAHERQRDRVRLSLLMSRRDDPATDRRRV